MKKCIRSLLGIVLAATTVAAVMAETNSYGEKIANRETTPIVDILTDPQAYNAKTVTIEGTIAQECPTGCWFNVKVANGEATIYVDIGKSGFAIPQYKGKKILVEGTVELKDGSVMIQGKGVEIQ